MAKAQNLVTAKMTIFSFRCKILPLHKIDVFTLVPNPIPYFSNNCGRKTKTPICFVTKLWKRKTSNLQLGEKWAFNYCTGMPHFNTFIMSCKGKTHQRLLFDQNSTSQEMFGNINGSRKPKKARYQGWRYNTALSPMNVC